MNGLENIWWVPILPLIGAIMNGLFGYRMGKGWTTFWAIGTTGLSFLVALAAFLELVSRAPGARVFEKVLFTWIQSGCFGADAGLRVDPLSGVFMLIVTGVGFLIHVYSVGYMGSEDAYPRFFCYLNLFMFAMLLLVMGNNFLLMFIGWEGVGLCSYLLIGYYYTKDSAADAGKKAFVMNRVGDFGFILAVFWIFVTFGAVDYATVFSAAPGSEALLRHTKIGLDVVTCITLLLFVGATGKSAQIPLYTWLPDAMEGPTPVSALIHAATMVTAGVYMVARCNVLFSMAPVSMMVVAAVGAVTAIFAATMGLYQNDIKRVLAYSTVSQLGYMFLACGMGAYVAAVFHVMTHAFFKACLFLGSGSVIHGMSGEQDMRQMGGLKQKMPHTHWTFLISTLAIAGIPVLSGFFSKDEILLSAFLGHTPGHYAWWALATVAAFVTAFYMFRLYFMTFTGKLRAEDHHVRDHVHESPFVMTVPLMILAFLAAVGGFLGLPAFVGPHVMADWLAPVLAPQMGAAPVAHGAAAAGHGAAAEGHHVSVAMELALMAVSVGVALAGIFAARYFYFVRPEAAEEWAKKEGLVHTAYVTIQNKYYVDEIYDFLITNPVVAVSRRVLHRFFDVKVVDGLVNGTASFTLGAGGVARNGQTGRLRDYATVMAASTLALVWIWIIYLQ